MEAPSAAEVAEMQARLAALELENGELRSVVKKGRVSALFGTRLACDEASRCARAPGRGARGLVCAAFFLVTSLSALGRAAGNSRVPQDVAKALSDRYDQKLAAVEAEKAVMAERVDALDEALEAFVALSAERERHLNDTVLQLARALHRRERLLAEMDTAEEAMETRMAALEGRVRGVVLTVRDWHARERSLLEQAKEQSLLAAHLSQREHDNAARASTAASELERVQHKARASKAEADQLRERLREAEEDLALLRKRFGHGAESTASASGAPAAPSSLVSSVSAMSVSATSSPVMPRHAASSVPAALGTGPPATPSLRASTSAVASSPSLVTGQPLLSPHSDQARVRRGHSRVASVGGVPRSMREVPPVPSSALSPGASRPPPPPTPETMRRVPSTPDVPSLTVVGVADYSSTTVTVVPPAAAPASSPLKLAVSDTVLTPIKASPATAPASTKPDAVSTPVKPSPTPDVPAQSPVKPASTPDARVDLGASDDAVGHVEALTADDAVRALTKGAALVRSNKSARGSKRRSKRVVSGLGNDELTTQTLAEVEAEIAQLLSRGSMGSGDL